MDIEDDAHDRDRLAIVVVGAGSVGRALGIGFVGAGHDVVHAVRDPADPRHADLRTTAVDGAAHGADLVVLAVPAASVPDVVGGLGLVAGQVVADATNAVRMPVPEGHATMGDLVAARAPAGVAVAKAFGTVGAERLHDGRVDGTPTFLPLAGDPEALALLVPLAEQVGFAPVALGGRDWFGHVEAHARLWIHLAMAVGWGRGFAFSVVRG